MEAGPSRASTPFYRYNPQWKNWVKSRPSCCVAIQTFCWAIPSIHSSIIKGGSELSVIPSQSCLQWERRTLPGESSRDLTIELERIIQAVDSHKGDHKVQGREFFVRPPYRVPDDAEVLKRLQKATPQSRLVGLSFWADSALAGAMGIPSVLFGPTGHGAHAVDEWVSLGSLLNVYETLKKLILDFY